MERSPQGYASRFRATLLGAAVADALSYPLTDYSRTFLRSLARPVAREYMRHPDGSYPLGQYTEDTQAWMAVVRAILEAGRVDQESVAHQLIPLWRDLTVVAPDPSSTEAMSRLVGGVTSWRDSGLPPGRAEAGGLSRALAVGLWDAHHPELIPEDTATVLRITHTDPRVLGAGAGLAAALAYNLNTREIVLGGLLDSVSEAAAHFCEPLAEAVQDLPRVISQTDFKAWQLLEAAVPDADYPPREDGLGNYAVPAFLLSLYYFLKTPTDLEHTLDRCARIGGEGGAMATMAAALCASRLGMESVPKTLLEGLLNSDELSEIVDDFLDAHMRSLSRPAKDPGETEEEGET